MLVSPRLLKGVRLAHLYLGVFVAPAVLFFAFTGAIQTFSLHETTRGSSYQPPRIFVVLGQIHKKQTPVIAVQRPQLPNNLLGPPPDSDAAHFDHHTPPEAQGATATSSRESTAKPTTAPAQPVSQHNPLPLKIFFLLAATSLTLSTFTGVYMAYTYSRNKFAISTLIILGAVIPVLLVLL
jgi:hypothetical protein